MNEPQPDALLPDSSSSSAFVPPDPFVWLEEIDSERSLEWVRARNQNTEGTFFDASFEADQKQIYETLTRPDSIPFVERRGGLLYNFWQDAQHTRGLWRRTSLQEYQREQPQWEVLLDLDALAREENKDWVWRGCSSWEPEHRLGLMRLSRGGGDATVHREFDLEQRRFVEDGFTLPEAKGGAMWLDTDTLLVSSALGGATTSGYARTVRRWKRGTPFEAAEVFFEGEPEDMAVSGAHWREPGFERTLFFRSINFEDSEAFLQQGDGTLQKLDVPLDADVGLHQDYLTVRLRSDWELAQRSYATDSLLVIRFSAFLEGSREFEVLFETGAALHFKKLFLDAQSFADGSVGQSEQSYSGGAARRRRLAYRTVGRCCGHLDGQRLAPRQHLFRNER